MAGSTVEDNPVGINVTPMVDVIFCLCLFFMCSLHFKQLEGKIDSWLPREHGNKTTAARQVILEEIRLLLRLDPATGQVTRRVGSRAPARDDADLAATIRLMADDHRRVGRCEVPVVIDSTSDVPWK